MFCIPNGELGNLFNKKLIQNFKTYKYYTKVDGAHFTPVSIPSTASDKKAWAETHCLGKGYVKITIPQTRGSKDIFLDAVHQCYWTYTSENSTKMVKAILHGDSMRLNNAELKERFDSRNSPWDDYIEFDI